MGLRCASAPIGACCLGNATRTLPCSIHSFRACTCRSCSRYSQYARSAFALQRLPRQYGQASIFITNTAVRELWQPETKNPLDPFDSYDDWMRMTLFGRFDTAVFEMPGPPHSCTEGTCGIG